MKTSVSYNEHKTKGSHKPGMKNYFFTRGEHISFIRPKLTINNPSDQYEQEADAVADKVMQMDQPSIQTKTENNLFFKPASIAVTPVQRKCAHCEEEEKKMQRKEMNGMIQRQPAPPAEESDIDLRRNPPGEKHDIKDAPNLATVDLLDPLNSSVCYKDFCLPSVRSVMDGLKKFKGNEPAKAVNNFPIPGLTKDQIREAACRNVPSLCTHPPAPGPGTPNLTLSPIELHIPKFQFFDHRIFDHFIFNKYDVPARHKSLLDKTAAELAGNPDLVTNITGHTDVHGGDEYNQALSENRAHSVEQYFLTANVPSSQIWSVSGMGKQQPRFTDDAVNTVSASKNRRVELDIKKLIWNASFSSAPAHTLQLQRKCAHCEKEENKIQRKELNIKETTADNSLENYVGSLSSNGKPLPNEVRNFYEPRFGYDFSNVKVHTDNVAAKSAQSVNALAYTSGNNIVFNKGQYAPYTNSGKKLLGHELTHVVQQNGGIFIHNHPALQCSPDNDSQKDTPASGKSLVLCPSIYSLEATVKASSVVSDVCNKKCRMELGCCPTERGKCGSAKTSGAVIKATVDIPKDCAGELGFMQNVLSSNRKRTLSDKSEECLTVVAAHVDGGVPYKGCKLEIKTPGHYSLETDDCPNIQLEDNMASASANDSFKTFLLWKSKGEKSWKPVANVAWAWNASTVRKKGDDCTSNWTSPVGKSVGNIGESSTDKPVASPDIKDEKWGKCGKLE
ncbi:MAG: DUF4157 domain-containing protein [Panacibacter sp.]